MSLRAPDASPHPPHYASNDNLVLSLLHHLLFHTYIQPPFFSRFQPFPYPTSTRTKAQQRNCQPLSHPAPFNMLPRPPPKDQFLSANTGYINQDLAEAVRDSVRIKSPDWSNRSYNSYSSAQQFDDPYTHTGTRRTPSPNPPRPINVFQPNKPSYNDLSPEVDNFDDMASDPASAQPALPSARMQQLKNPFEEDEIEPAGTGAIKPPDIRNFALEGNGAGQPRRNKFSRAQTGYVSCLFFHCATCVASV